MPYPVERMQRARQKASIRKLVQETRLTRDCLIAPLFIREEDGPRVPVSGFPGVYQETLSTVLEATRALVDVGISSLLLFGVPKDKDPTASGSFQADGIVQRATACIKDAFPELILINDCCLCDYTSHGSCGILKDNGFDHESTLETLGKIAVSYARSGVDIVAPSGMMDGMVRAIREALDQAGYPLVSIMSYAAKYASSFYGPFRTAVGSSANLCGDRSHHQMAPSQTREAIREAKLDVEEGADFLMVKPGMPYLDIVYRLKETFMCPIAIYQVSGEYAMLKNAALAGIVDEKAAFFEALISMRRAGADMIISYYSREIAENL